MKHPNQIRNFFRHANKFGYFSSLVILIFSYFTADEFWYDDDGVSRGVETFYTYR